MATVALALLAFAVPALNRLARDRVRQLSFLDTLLASYALGIALGNMILLGQAASRTFELATTVMLGLSIPLMLFTMNVRSWGKAACGMMLGMGLACASAVVALAAGAIGDLVAYAVGASVLLHALFCRLLGLDRDTMMVSPAAAAFGSFRRSCVTYALRLRLRYRPLGYQ